MEKIAIIGAGGFGREVKTLIDDINNEKPTYEIIGFFDDGITQGKMVNGLPIIGDVNSINDVGFPLNIALGIGEPNLKNKIINSIKNEMIEFPNLIHPSVIISTDGVIFGKGNIVCAGNIITCNITLESFITLNLSCTIGHDVEIGNYSSFMPSVNISGEVLIYKNVYVGTGAKIINQLEIGRNSTIGAGAVVIKDVPDYAVVVGNPARIVKYNQPK